MYASTATSSRSMGMGSIGIESPLGSASSHGNGNLLNGLPSSTKMTRRRSSHGSASGSYPPKSPSSRSKSPGPSSSSSRYPFRLNFYSSPPSLEITLEEFEQYAIARLKILTFIHSLTERNIPPSQANPLIQAKMKECLPLSSGTARNMPLEEERKADELSHWVLRLAFCRSPDLREKFIRTEVDLFRQRFETDDRQERMTFIKTLSFDWLPVDEAEKSMLASDLRSVMPKGTREEQFRAEVYVKVPWYNVPDLVATRRVLIKGGYAYVPQMNQISLVTQAFRQRLEKALELTAKSLPRMDEDDRLMPILAHLAQSFLQNVAGDNNFFGDVDPNENQVTADMVDAFAKKHFPACQFNLWQRLKQHKHLKHGARLQFGLFMKGLGLPVDEAILYFRRNYGVGSSMTEDRFNKDFRYNIRHNYGLEGGRKNYTARSCQQILTSNPGPGDVHGCPYRHMAPENLAIFLIQAYPGAVTQGGPELREIMDNVKKSHYHLACTRVFELTHPKDVKKGEGLGNGDSVNHPNEYFNKSLEFERAREGGNSKGEDAMQVE